MYEAVWQAERIEFTLAASLVGSCSTSQHVKTPLCEINDPKQKVVTQKTNGENRQTAAAVNPTKDNYQEPVITICL